MTSSCKIVRKLRGSEEKNYNLIKYIKNELEKHGLNPKIYLIISDEEQINLFNHDIKREEPEKSTIKWGFTIPFFNTESKKNGESSLKSVETLFNQTEEDSHYDYSKPIDPKAVTRPYLNFKDNLDILFNYNNSKKSGGSIQGKQRYNKENIEIMIEL